MKSILKRWAAPPKFTGDIEKTWRANFLNATLIISMLFGFILFISNSLGGKAPVILLAVDAGTVLVCILIRRILFTGRIALTGILIGAVGMGFVTVGIAGLGTIRTPTTAVFLLLIIVAGITFGWKGLIISTISSSIILMGLIIAENNNLLPTPDYTVTITQWVSYTLFFGLTGALTHFSHRSILLITRQLEQEIINRQRIEDGLRENEIKFRTMFESSREAIGVSDQSGAHILANPAYVQMFGYSNAEELIGKPILDCIAPAARQTIIDNVRRRAQGETVPRLYETQGLRKDGVEFDMDVRVSAYALNEEMYSLTMLRDITDRKQIEEELRTAKEQFETAVTHAPIPMVIIDANQDILLFNNKFTELFGYTIDDISTADAWWLAAYPNETYRQVVQESCQKAIEAAKATGNEIETQEWDLTIKDGSVRRIELKMSVLGETSLIAMNDITERRQTEQALQASESRAVALLEAIPDMMFRLDRDGFYLDYMAEKQALYYQGDSIIGKNNRDITPPEFADLIEEYVERTLNSGERQTFNYQLPNAAGIPISYEARMVKSGANEIITIVRDITEGQQTEEALRKSEENLTKAQRIAQLGSWTWNLATDEIYWSDEMRRIYGFEPDEKPVNKTVYEMIHPEDKDLYDQAMASLATGEAPPSLEYRIIRTDGQERLLLVNAKMHYDESGTLVQMVGTVQDITKRKQVEEDLRKAKDEAEAASHAKSAFLSRMSHELRTPLNGILGYTQLFKRDATLTAAQQNGIDVIHRSGQHLLTMINEILDFSKIEANHMELVPVEFHFPRFLEVINDMIQLRAKEEGLTYRYQPDSELPQTCFADKTRLRQILLNLLSNAVKFTEQGGVTLRVQKRAANLIRFEVIDTGIGIPPEQQSAIFEPFRQIGDKRIQQKGTGLGLTISQNLTYIMGSELHLESSDNGSRFWFDLSLSPILPTNNVEETATTKAIGYTRKAGNGAFRVLLVDDFSENRTVLKEFLTSLFFTVAEAENGREALEETAVFKPDLIFMDIVMPYMDGLEATRQLRRLSGYEDLPIIAISASASPKSRQASLTAGCNGFLPKPYETKELLNKLEQHLPLTWIYEDMEKRPLSPPQQPTTTATRAALPPLLQADLEELLELSMIGDIMGLKNRLRDIELQDSRYAPFTNAIKRLAVDFKMYEIEQYIRSFVEG